jgi:hypothetical protein
MEAFYGEVLNVDSFLNVLDHGTKLLVSFFGQYPSSCAYFNHKISDTFPQSSGEMCLPSSVVHRWRLAPTDPTGRFHLIVGK